MIHMEHKDGDTTILLTQTTSGFMVTLASGSEGTVARRDHAKLDSALADYVLTISAELGCYVGDDVPWYSAVRPYSKPDSSWVQIGGKMRPIAR